MTLLKTTIKVLALVLLLNLTSCKAQYPDLEDGIYAEIITSKGTNLILIMGTMFLEN